MSSSESEDNIQIQIREREKDDDEYVKPALLKEYEEEVARENAEISSDEEEEEEEEEESTDESDEEEDEVAALLTPSVDSQIFKTIAAIRAKDPSVYDSSKKFFTDDDFKEAQKQLKQQQQDKKVTLKDYERQMLLEHGGYVDEEKEDEENKKKNDLTHVEEQAQLKKAFQLAVNDDEEEGEDNDDDFLIKRDKSKSEMEDEESDYRKFLLENLKGDETSATVIKEWDNLKDNSNVNPDDAFLMNYVLNRGWVDKKGKTNPTYNEIVDVDKDEDEQYLDNVDRFESKYNFRYEEGGSAQIITHARDIPGSVRRKESKRKRQRERLKAKKQALKEQKLEEIKRLKNEKRKEIHDRLLEIQNITGTGVTGFENIDLEGDFDPEKYDEQMSKVFNDDYYANQDNEKPVFEDLDDDDFNYDEDDNNNNEDIMMDADYLPGGEKYEESQQNKKKKGKGKAKEIESSSVTKDTKNIKDQEYNKLMDEYYSLDFEDVIGGDLATRYKYIQTEPEDFGMTAEEILLADDKELNKVISIKTLAPYRNELKRKSELNTYNKNKKQNLRNLRRHVESKKKQFY